MKNLKDLNYKAVSVYLAACIKSRHEYDESDKRV